MQKVDEAPATVLLEELNLRRVKLRADGDQLRIRAPKGMLTPDLKRRLQQHKDSLLQLLRDRQAAADGASVQAPEPATETRFPLSPAQRRIWFLDRLEPGNSSYNIATILHLEGELQVTILARTLDEIRRRHATLRTTFEDDAEGPVQVVRPPTPVPLAPVDGSDWSTRRQEAWIERQIERPFDLERGPLFRCAWLQRGDRRHGLVLTLHHIVGDARSAVLLVRELEALYQAFSQGEPSPLADLPEQYAETIRPTVSGDNQRLLDYWRRQLTPLPRPLDLGGDRPPPDQRTSCGDRVVLALPSALGRALTALARRHDATLFMTLLAACTAHLYRLTGRHDLCVGVPIANRDRRDTEGLIGLFVDTLVLRTDIAGLADFPALLEQVRSTALEAFDHAALPFEELVAALKPPRDGHRMPLVQVMFNLADLTELAIELPNLRTEVELTMPGSRFDLTFYVLREGDDLRLEAAYSTDLFSRTRMLEWLDQYRRLLEQVATRSARSLHRLSLLTDDFAARLPAPAPPRWPADELAHQRFARQAQRLGDRVAVRDANSSWTYARLDREANQLAHHLRQHGIGREGVVALFADRRAELAWAMLGVLKAGAAFVVLDPDHPEQRLADVVHSLPVVGWIAFHHRTPAGALQAALADTDLRCRLDRPGAADAGWRAAPGEALPREPHPDDLAYVACTSGTTGRPLTIATPHRPLAHYLAWCEASFDLGGEDRFSLLAGLAHDPLLRDVLTPLWLGGTLCCPTAEERLAPGRLAPWMAREAISVSHLTPALGEVLTADDTLLPALRQAFCGGDRLRGALVERLRRQAPAARIVNLYGTTETPQAMGCHIVQEDPPLSEVPLGRGIDGVRLRIASPTDMLAGCGELGEILVETPFLARGYLGRPGRTAERFTPSPESAPGGRVYRTGDLGRWTPNGDVVFVRRRDRQLQIRGLRVEPTEIETVLERHPEVARAVVTARSEGTGDRSAPVLAAYFVGASGPTNEQVDGPARVDDLRQHLRAALPASLVPAVLIPLDALPLTANGKIDLEALPAPDPFSASDKPKTAPRHPLEAILLDLWAEILGLDGIGVDDDFFALGGHSLLATRLLSRIRQSLGHEVPLGRFFDRPTVSAVARYLTTDSTEGPKRPPLTAAASPTDQGLSFAQQRLWFVEQLQPESPAYLLARAFTLRGPLEPLALDRALRQIVHRHRPLRTAFPTVDGHPVADLGPVPRRLLARVDLTRLEVQARRRETRHHVAREARQPLDLAIGPLLRVTLLELEAQHHVLLLTLHHLAADASSITILRHELAELYGALREGRLVPGRDLELHYSDFAAWQRQCAESGCDETDLTYWRRQLADLPPFELPLGRPRRATTPPRGEACRLALAHDLTRSLRAVGRSHRATLFMTLLATFELLLSRLGAGDDLAVGTAIDQRWRRRLEPLIGLFLNSLVLRTDLSGRPTFADLLGRVRQTVLDATVHQHVPFERLVDELLATRDLDRTPFFQVFCNLVDATAHRFELPGLLVEEWPRAPELTAKFDLALHLLDRGDAIECVLVYDGERFDRAPMHEILEQFRHLAQQVCQQPGKPIDAFELLRPEIAVHWPDPALPIPTPHHEAVPRAFLQQAYQAPERSAIRQGTHTLTYGHLAQQAQRVARTLIAEGLRPGEVVALHGKRDIELVAALIGVQMSGGVLLLIDQDLPKARKRLMVRQADARFLLDLAPAPAEIWVDDAAIQRVDIVVGEPTTARLPQLDPAAPAYIFFTSGSTGTPKGVRGSHRGLSHFLAWQRERFTVGPGDRVAGLATLSFDAVLRDVWLPLTSGATLCLPDTALEPGTEKTLGWIADEGVSVLHVIPSVARFWLAGRAARRLEHLRWTFFVGEPLLDRDVQTWRSLVGDAAGIVNFYGPTETTLIKCFHVVPASPAPGIQLLGQPLPQTQAFVLGPDERLCGPGEPGEIVLRTPFRSLGYLDAEQTAFTANPFAGEQLADDEDDLLYPTGDRGYLRPDGNLVFLGRLDHQLKIRGIRVEPAEIEAQLISHPAIRAAAVVAVDSGSGPQLVAHVVGASGEDVPAVRRFLRRQLPAGLVPGAIVTHPALPRTASGKIDRVALARQVFPAAATDLDAPPHAVLRHAPPRDSIEVTLVDLWRELLGERSIGIHDDFFALGGHSLLAVRLLARLQERLDVTVPLRTFFRHSTVAGLASCLEGAGSEGRRQLPPLGPSNDPSDAPLSFAQQRLWFLDRLEPGSGAYHIARSIPLEGPLDLAALDGALIEIVRRHQALRTVFLSRDGEPRQRLEPTPATLLATVDLRHVEAGHRNDRAQAEIEAAVRRPFDLRQDLMLRALVLRLGETAWELLLDLHHIAADGVSMEVFARELSTAYRARIEPTATGRHRAMPKLAIQYTDFARWQRSWLQGEIRQELLAYWCRQLEGLSTLELPTDRPRPTMASEHGDRLPLVLDPSTTTALKALAVAHGSTLFMVLLAAFQSLLQRHSGQDDIVVGTPIANRTHSALERLIGCFANTLVLRGDLGEDPTAEVLLARLRATCLDAYAHQDMPFEKLVDALEPERDLGRNPLVQVMLSLQQRAGVSLDLGPVSHGPIRARGRAVKLDLHLAVLEDAEQLHGFLEYRRELFDSTTAHRFLRHWQNLLDALTRTPRRRLSRLPMLSPAESHQLRREWNDTRAALPQAEGLHDLIRRQAARTPDAIAVSSDEVDCPHSLSYGQLWRRAESLAHRLAALGVGPETRVAVAMERSCEMMVALLGVLEAGAAYLPLDPAYPPARLAFMLADADCPVLLTQARLLATLPTSSAHVIVLDPPLGDVPAASPRRGDANGESLAYLIYTSGSTGRPKGVMCSHRGILNRLRWMQQAYGLSTGDRVLQKTPTSFDVSVWELFWPLLVGARLVMARPEGHKDSAYLRDTIERHAITTLHFVPSMLGPFLDHLEASQEELEVPPACPTLQRVFASGEALPAHLARQLRGLLAAELHNLYGPTEASVDVTSHRCRPGEQSLPIGRPITNLSLHLVDRHLRPAALGVTGELFLGGVGLARGYQSRPGRTAAYFVPDPFAEHPGERLYRTGDLTRQRQDGAVDYLGRADTQVKIRGFRIELGEIEAALENQTGIRQAVVVARDGRLDAYCVPARGSGLDVSTLRAALAKALPDFMLPATFTALSEIPRLANGKTDRRSLPAPGPERPALATAMASPRNRVEGLLAELWARVLRLDQVGIHDNFFELGGDSILTIRIVSRAAQRGLRFTPRDLFQHQTVARLATVAQAAAVPTADQGAIVGPVPLLPIQHWFFERDWSQPWHYNWAAVWSTPRPLAFAPLLRAVERLEGHHDALRLRFRRHDDGWRQRIARPAATRAASWIDLSRLDGVEAGDDIEAIVQQAAAHLQPSLDLASGPIFRAVYFGAGRGRPSLLLLMVHHLAVDGVSWGLLRQDFVAAYRHEERAPSGGVAAKQPLPAKTTSFKAWAEHLVQAAGGAASQRAAEHWLAFNRSPSPLPVDFEEGENSVASTATVTVSLDVGETRELLRSLPTTQHARVDEVLLTALAAALCRFIGSTRLRIDLEGHGRQGDLESSRRPTEAPLDLSRTVGWLTTLFPVVLDLGDPSDSAGHRLRTVKQQLRAIPNVGLDFGIQRYLRAADQRRPLEELPCSEVLFNYLGQGDRADEDEEALLGESTIEVGARQSPEGRRSHLLEILATVRGETLQMHWRYSRRRHRRATIEALAKDFLGELRHLLDPNLTAPGTGLLPSDFPLADIGSATLDRLTAAWAGEIEDIYRTSPTQEALFYYDLYHPASEAYIEHMTVSLHGRLDLARLHRAGQRLLERHPVLRTALVWEGLEEPRQVVLRQVELPWTEEDWRHLPPAEQQRRFQALIRQDRRHGFDLRQAPLIRWTVARLSNETHRLMWCYHHVILDGWSMPLLVREAFELYLADGPIASPPRPFRDYLAWRAERKTARAEVFWRRSLEGVTAATPLPFDRPLDREDAPARIETVGVRLGDRAADLGALARHRRLTLNTLIQAAWSLTLGAFSGEEEVIFGATLAARPGEIEGVERMVGLFINTLPVRLSVAPHGRLGDLLARLQSWNVEMRQFDDSRLFDLHAWSDIPRGQPIFNSAILFQNYPHQPSSDLAALGLSPSGYRSFGTTSYPLTLTVKPTDGFNVSLAYDARRFDRSTAARLLAATRHLLELFVADADQALAALAPLPPAARHQVLTEWNDTASIGDAPPPWSELFRRQVEQAPDRLAVESAEGSLTYGELGRRVEHLARHLRSLGVARDARIGLLMVRTPEMVTSMLAILRAGAAYVPLDPLYPRERMAFILAECGAAAVLTLERLVDDLPPLEVPVLQVDRDWAGIPRRQAAVWPEPAVGQLAYVIYTSGSTGRPKGVAIAERALTTYALDAAAQLAIRPSDRMLQFASISFDTSAEEIFPTLVRGATLRLRTEPMLESPAVFLDTCARWRITLLDLPTAYWHELTTSFARRPLAMPPTLRWVIIGGESARADDLVAWQRHAGDPVRLLNTYGPTEATIVATRRELTAAIDASPLVSIGNAIPRAAAHVVDRWLRSVPVGVAGELVLAGAGLARGYLERPRHTARSFVPNPLGAAPGERLYKTGDRVRRRADADLLFLGRFDHQVKVRGLRIELGEIERALETSAEIADAVVTVRASSGLGKADRGERPHLVAYVVLATSTGSEPTPASLRAHLKTSLPFYMLPAAFVVLGAFPMTSSGKVDRRALPAPPTQQTRPDAYAPPRTPTETVLAEIWREVLSVDRVGRDDDYFDLGGHSLLAVRLMAKIQQRFGVHLTLAMLFRDFTVRGLARLIEASSRPS